MRLALTYLAWSFVFFISILKAIRCYQRRSSVPDAPPSTLPQEVDELKRQVNAEQRGANDWREKWNFQNFKLNLMVDMLVLRVLEQVGLVEVWMLCEKHRFACLACNAQARAALKSNRYANKMFLCRMFHRRPWVGAAGAGLQRPQVAAVAPSS